MISSSVNPAMVAHNLTKAVEKHSHYGQTLVGVVSLSIFGGNFVLAKVHQGTSVSVVRS